MYSNHTVYPPVHTNVLECTNIRSDYVLKVVLDVFFVQKHTVIVSFVFSSLFELIYFLLFSYSWSFPLLALAACSRKQFGFSRSWPAREPASLTKLAWKSLPHICFQAIVLLPLPRLFRRFYFSQTFILTSASLSLSFGILFMMSVYLS
jgi:hypothetical protein